MKKLFALLLALVMMMSLVACGETPDTTGTTAPTEPAIVLPASALEMMTNIIDAWDFEYKSYFMGGGYSNPVDGAPGAVAATDTDTLQYLMYVPEACLSFIEDAASYCHSMNYSVFTSGTFKVTDAKAFCTSLQEGLANTQWMCGIPEYLMIYTLGNEYVLFVMGTAENLEAYGPALKAAYPDAVAVFDGLMG